VLSNHKTCSKFREFCISVSYCVYVFGGIPSLNDSISLNNLNYIAF
jgi:hypothetical protein